MECARAQPSRRRPGQRAVERIHLGEQLDVRARVAARERPSRASPAIRHLPAGPILPQQPRDLGSRPAGHPAQEEPEGALVGLPEAGVVEPPRRLLGERVGVGARRNLEVRRSGAVEKLPHLLQGLRNRGASGRSPGLGDAGRALSGGHVPGDGGRAPWVYRAKTLTRGGLPRSHCFQYSMLPHAEIRAHTFHWSAPSPASGARAVEEPRSPRGMHRRSHAAELSSRAPRPGQRVNEEQQGEAECTSPVKRGR